MALFVNSFGILPYYEDGFDFEGAESKRYLSVFNGQLFLLFLTEGVIMACARYLPEFAIFTGVTSVLFILLMLFYCVRMMIAYFDRDQIERADLRKYY